MTYPAALQHIPILLIDVADFTSKHRGRERQRILLKTLQQVATDSARFFMPYGDVWSKWLRHGTGDGYYFLFDAMPPQVALKYALELSAGLGRFNAEHTDLEIRLRQVLVQGDVEWVEDQILSEVFAVAERLISYGPFKDYCARQGDPAPLAASDLFHLELEEDLAADGFEELANLSWTAFEAVDKHGRQHSGYVLGEGWEEPEAAPAPEPGERLRVLILIGHSVEDPLPEAVEMAKVAARGFEASGLHVEVRVDQASVAALRREAKRGCDLLIYYGHGTEDGHLSFVDGRKAFSHLGADASLGEFWQELPTCFLFACYGDRFAERLPGPWVAFSEPILTAAPKGFLEALIPALAGNDLAAAVAGAREICGEAMRSDFTEAMRFSGAPLPTLRAEAGEPLLSRLSPALSNRVWLDFASLRDGDHLYPDHEPFVGRVADLKRLLSLPEPFDDRSRQRVAWVHGDAGMGKSALLRQFAVRVRDLIFHESEEPVWLLHLYCYRFTRPEEVTEELCARARELYGLDETPATPEVLARQLENRSGATGTHVWVLDDLTYLSEPDSSEKAARLVQSLLDSARSHVLRWQLVVSSRRPGPRSFAPIEVGPLTGQEAVELALRVRPAGTDGASVNLQDVAAGAALLFATVHRSTAHYKRSLVLAAEFGMSYSDYALGLAEEGGLEAIPLTEQAEAMVAYEVKRLGELEGKHGFAYRDFLAVYYPLITRAGWFTGDELAAWFGDRLAAVGRRREVGYRNGLKYLARLNLLAVQRRDGRQVFTMPPNQRLSMQTLRDPAAALPEEVPLRAPRERLSLALERAGKGDVAAVGELLSIEQDYRDDLDDPNAAAAVFHSMLLRSEFATEEDALPILGKIVELYDRHCRAYPQNELEASSAVTWALVNKGVRLGALGRSEEELAVYDEVEARYGGRDEIALAEQVARALFNKGVGLGALGQSEEELAVYDEVEARYGGRDEIALAEPVAKALLNKGVKLKDLGRKHDAIEALNEVEARYSDRDELVLAEQVAKALRNKGLTLGALGRSKEELAVYDEIEARYGHRDELPIAEQVIQALFNKGVTLGHLEQSDEEIAVYDKLEARYSGRNELPLARSVARALVNKGTRLAALERNAQAIAVYDEVEACFSGRGELAIAEQVAKALLGKGFALGALGRSDEQIAVYDEVEARYGGRDELPLASIAAAALVSKGFRLGALGRSEEEIALYDEVEARYGDREELGLAESVVKALYNKGFRLRALGRSKEEIAVYGQVEARYGGRDELALAEQVAKALVDKGIRLGALGRTEEELAVYDQLKARYGDRDELTLAEQVAKALLGKSIRLGALGRTEEELAVYDQLEARYGGRDELALAESVAKALVNKGVRLGALQRSEEELAVYDQVEARYGRRDELALAEPVATALVNKGSRLGVLGRSEEAIAVYDELDARYGDRDELALAEKVAGALVNKGIRLGELGRSEEAIAVYNELDARYGGRDEPPLAETVASAISNKSNCLLTMGSLAEAGSQEQLDSWQRVEEAVVKYSHRTGKPLEQIYNYACLLALRGEESPALEALAQCLEADSISVDHVRNDSDWDSLRASPDFEALLRRYESPPSP